jgi:hypothetical protein
MSGHVCSGPGDGGNRLVTAAIRAGSQLPVAGAAGTVHTQ